MNTLVRINHINSNVTTEDDIKKCAEHLRDQENILQSCRKSLEERPARLRDHKYNMRIRKLDTQLGNLKRNRTELRAKLLEIKANNLGIDALCEKLAEISNEMKREASKIKNSQSAFEVAANLLTLVGKAINAFA